MHKLPNPTSLTGLHRRHFLAAIGGGLIASSRVFATPSPELISERLAQLERDGSVS